MASARRAGGYATWTDPDTGVLEQDTNTCSHCNTVFFVKPKCSVAEAPDLCRMCMKMICPRCADALVRGGGCVPFEAQCDAVERRDRLRRQIFGSL